MLKKGLYQHFKGAFYKVLEVAKHSENEEQLVVYQALYGDKGIWARPLSMFTEQVERDGKVQPRFTYLEPQSEVLEVAVLDVKPGQQNEFEQAFALAQEIISHRRGYISHSLKKSLAQDNRYILLVNWQTREDHTKGFRKSAEYQEWARLLHDFYDPFPAVEHYQNTRHSN